MGDATRSRLVNACFDRAILLPELHDSVLRTHLHIPVDELPAVKAVAPTIVYDLAGEIGTPGRYLPQVTHRQGQSYDVWLSKARTAQWTWLEMAACGVTLNGWHMGTALECV